MPYGLRSGPRGPRGPTGPAGPTGPEGPQGPSGSSGDGSTVKVVTGKWEYIPAGTFTMNSSNRTPILTTCTLPEPITTALLSAHVRSMYWSSGSTMLSLSWSGLSAATRDYNINICPRYMVLNDDNTLSPIPSTTSGVERTVGYIHQIGSAAAASGSTYPSGNTNNAVPPPIISTTPITRLAIVLSAYRSGTSSVTIPQWGSVWDTDPSFTATISLLQPLPVQAAYTIPFPTGADIDVVNDTSRASFIYAKLK